MTNKRTPEEDSGSPNVTNDRLRDANEQLTLTSLQAQQRAEEAAERYQDQAKALIHKQEELRDLASELTLTEQRERKHLAMELHDYLAQMLVLGRLKIGQARQRMTSADSFLVDLINDLDDIFGKSLDYTRTLMAELSPATLRESGLPLALKGLGGQMMKHGLAVDVHASHDHVPLPDDQAILLYQSARELLLNVVKHARTDHAMVSITLGEGERLTLSVRDQGLGFDTGSLQAQSAGEHFGLLSVMERMEAMGGSFEADSGPGRGTTITLRLPLKSTVIIESVSMAATIPVELLAGPKDHTSGVRRVLLVDDHAMVRQGLRAILATYADVTIIGEAKDGIEAVKMAAELAPDVILMDINMPQMDGIEATLRIKAAQPAAIVIGLSVNNSTQAMDAIKRAGAATLISKEAAAEQLHAAIAALVP
jgi:signal transduction histidine kinase